MHLFAMWFLHFSVFDVESSGFCLASFRMLEFLQFLNLERFGSFVLVALEMFGGFRAPPSSSLCLGEAGAVGAAASVVVVVGVTAVKAPAAAPAVAAMAAAVANAAAASAAPPLPMVVGIVGAMAVASVVGVGLGSSFLGSILDLWALRSSSISPSPKVLGSFPIRSLAKWRSSVFWVSRILVLAAAVLSGICTSSWDCSLEASVPSLFLSGIFFVLGFRGVSWLNLQLGVYLQLPAR